MSLFYFLLCLSLPSLSFAQTCTEASFPAGGGTVNCTTLTINNAVNFTPSSGAAPLEFIVTGDVVINANITIDGQAGKDSTSTDPTPGGVGGPGASDGGGISVSQGEPGLGGTPSDGNSHTNNGVCNHGGSGGGGILVAGQDGALCAAGGPPNAPPEGIGGVASGFPSPFRGGFGAGAGGAITYSGPQYDIGAGGGGGGGLHIQSTSGIITIKNGARISARGGNGGNSLALGGAGGGGSGGVIWLQSILAINNKGIIDVRGGTGGINTSTATPRGGAGGSGGDGIFRSEIAGVITDSTGLTSFASPGSLKSDISCGTIVKPNEDKPLALQVMIGFALAFVLSFAFKILFRSRRIIS
jgi:hypothetical protein